MAEKHAPPVKFAALGAETLGTWAELNQRVAQDLTHVSIKALEETTRAAADIQQATLAAVRNAQSAAFRWQTFWPEVFRDPLRWYQSAFEHGVSAMQEAIELGRRNAETAVRAFDRLQSQSEEAARTLEDTFKEGATKIRDIQSRTDTLRVA